MHFSRQHNRPEDTDSSQLGLDFVEEYQYITAPLKEVETMEAELFERLEEKINQLVSGTQQLKEENQNLRQELESLRHGREVMKGRIDNILSRLEGV